MNNKDAWKDERNLDDEVPFEPSEGEFNCPCSHIEEGDIDNCTECPYVSVEEELINENEMKLICKGEKPSYANQYAAGLDLRANNEESITIGVGEYADIPTELSIEIPKGYFGLVVPRSGLGFNYRITLINDIGVIDEDYRGNIGVRLLNEGKQPYTIKKGDRVAQMIIVPYIQPKLVFVNELSDTGRGTGGFGHTGR